MAFHQKFREKFSPDETAQQMQLPVYFGNICLRFLPILDIVIHRFLEVPMKTVNKILETILSHFGCLYKFHGKLLVRFFHCNGVIFVGIFNRSPNQLSVQHASLLRAEFAGPSVAEEAFGWRCSGLAVRNSSRKLGPDGTMPKVHSGTRNRNTERMGARFELLHWISSTNRRQ